MSGDISVGIAALQAQVEQNKQIMDGIADAVTVADENGKLIQHNAAAEQILKLLDVSKFQEEWKHASGFFHDDGVTPCPADQLPLARALRGEKLDNVVIYLRSPLKPDGVWMQASARPLLDSGGTFRGAVVIVRDITEQKRWERELARQLQREKRRASCSSA